MLLAGLRRLGILILLVLGVAVVAGVLGGLLFAVSVRRGISLACYGIGALLIVSGFFHGVRGPVRIEDEEGLFSMFGVLLTRGRIRSASLDERHESISSSALFVLLGFGLILVGALLDPVHPLL
jgi:hypothetical protein